MVSTAIIGAVSIKNDVAQSPNPAPRKRRKKVRPLEGEPIPPNTEFLPTPEQRTIAEALAGYGIPQDEIAKLITNPATGKGVSGDTLRKAFREELDRGQAVANSRVAGALFKNATTGTTAFPGGIPVAQIFWLKTRARWRTKDRFDDPPPPAPQAEQTDRARRLLFVMALLQQQAAPQRIEKEVVSVQSKIHEPA